MRHAGWLLSLAALGCGALGCGALGCSAPDADSPAPLAPPAASSAPAATTRWTVAVYMAADNDLEQEALYDVEEMLAASHASLRFVVQLDRSGASPFSVRGVASWQGAQRFVIADRKLTPAGQLGPVDTGAASTLAAFTSFAAAQAGSDRLAVVLWGHGHGALGLADDTTSGHRLAPHALGEALRQGLGEAGVARADFIGFDACSMADLVVASEVAPSARWMLASQRRTPASGWSYRALIDFARTGRDTAADLAELLATEALRATADLDVPPAWSLLDLDRVGTARDALDALATSEPPCAALAAPADPSTEDGMEDIYSATDRLASAPGLSARGGELRRAAAASVARRWSWPGTESGVGLSVLARLPEGAVAGGDGSAYGDEDGGWWSLLRRCREAP